MGGRCLVELNNTYGNLFTGDITLRDCEMITDGNDMSVIKLDFIGSNTPTRASVRMPNINIHNLKATNISSTEASLYMFNINGTSDFSSAETKIGRANYFKFEDISFNNLSNVNQNIQFIWDSTTKDMYQTDVRTDIKIKNTNFNQTLPTDGLFAYINCGEYIPTLTIGNYTITYNSTDDTLDFLFNGVISEPVVNNYVSEGLSLYIDANDVTTNGSIRDITGKQTIVNHGVSTVLDNNCLNFVASESDYIDGGFKPNLTKWSAEVYFYFTATPTSAETVLGWGASGNRTAIGIWGGDFMIAINGNVEHTIMDTKPISLTHLVLTYNNGTIIAYVNGAKSQIATNANLMSSQAGNLMIGTKYSASGEFGNIHLKSLRFYDGKVLTDEEALQNYNYETNRNDGIIKPTWTYNKKLDTSTGLEAAADKNAITNFIPYDNSYEYTLAIDAVEFFRVYYYDSSQSYIKNDSIADNFNGVVTPPENTVYMRLKLSRNTVEFVDLDNHVIFRKSLKFVLNPTWIDNRNINIQGVENDDTSAMVTDYLTKEDGYNYTINLTSVSSVKIYFFNSSKTFISRRENLTVNSTDTLIEFPENTVYFRIKSDKGTATVNNANDYIILKKVTK